MCIVSILWFRSGEITNLQEMGAVIGRVALLGAGGATMGTAADVVPCTEADCAQLASSSGSVCLLQDGLCVCADNWGTFKCELPE